VHVASSVRIELPVQAAPAQIGVRQLLDIEPVRGQSPPSGTHAPNGPHVSAPQVSPSVSRAQTSAGPGLVLVLHAPPAQTRLVHVVGLVPVSSQGSPKPEQGPTPTHDPLPQLSPSVSRAQPAVSVSIRDPVTHMPAVHVKVVTTRVRVLVSAHVST
jgi:hypothetical protein